MEILRNETWASPSKPNEWLTKSVLDTNGGLLKSVVVRPDPDPVFAVGGILPSVEMRTCIECGNQSYGQGGAGPYKCFNCMYLLNPTGTSVATPALDPTKITTTTVGHVPTSEELEKAMRRINGVFQKDYQNRDPSFVGERDWPDTYISYRHCRSCKQNFTGDPAKYISCVPCTEQQVMEALVKKAKLEKQQAESDKTPEDKPTTEYGESW